MQVKVMLPPGQFFLKSFVLNLKIKLYEHQHSDSAL
jgi:hypothetical protein